MKKIFEKEKIHLRSTIKKLKTAEKAIGTALSGLGSDNLSKLKDLRDDPITSGTDFMLFLQQLHEKNEAFNIKDKVKRLEEIEYLIKESYFARLDLEDSDGTNDSIYIGKFGYTEGDKPVVTDWRAKIASIYYRYRYPQKNVKYEALDGVITKDLLLKRTFEIDNGELIKYYNNDIQFDEGELIASKIEERTGGILEDIIETIQESQLDIIESDPRKVCIVQGCVGSGKSTVAIHKLSHTFFNYPNIIIPERSILVAKSGVLVSYLATLFPKLGIFDINYKTLRELIVNILFREEVKYKFDLDKNTDLSKFDVKKIKSLQAEFKKIHKYYEGRIEKILQKEEYGSFSGFVYGYNQPVKENIDEYVSELNEELDFQKNKLKDDPKSVKSWIYKENTANLRSLIRALQKLKQEIKTKTLIKLCKKWDVSLKDDMGFIQAMVYLSIHNELLGFNKSLKYQYCVVDEGQDFSLLEYFVLSKLVQHGRFCILGDLNQSYFKDGLKNWSELKHVITEAKKATSFELDTNYRSTRQIIEFANGILSPYTSDYLPKSIDRVGKNPVILRKDMINDVYLNFRNKIEKDLKSLNKSIGVICFSEKNYSEAEKIIEKLRKKRKIPAETFIKLDEKKRISYIPKGIYLSMFEDCKGLEFSKVYVLGLNLDSISDFSGAKKAFVAVTRAMNELVVYD